MLEGLSAIAGIVLVLLKHYLDPNRRMGREVEKYREEALEAVRARDGEKALALIRHFLSRARDSRLRRS